MNDHERFTKQMAEAFEHPIQIIGELPVPLVTRDKLAMYARQLREAAYQAGRAEQKTTS